MYFTVFAAFMDWIVRPIVWLTSPAYRSHMRVVHAQNAYLRNKDNPALTWEQKAQLKRAWIVEAGINGSRSRN